MRTSNRVCRPKAAPTRRGVAVYLFVLVLTMILAGTGLALVAVNRADRRVHTSVQRSLQARYAAQAGIEAALGYMDANANWRSTMPSGTWFNNIAFGSGKYTVVVTDADGNLANRDTDAATITSTATVNGAISRMQVTVAPRPYAALRYACFSQTTLDVRSNASILGPVRAHTSIYSDGNYDSEENAYFETLQGAYVNSAITPVRYATSSLSYPQPSLSYYLALATPITGIAGSTAQLSKYVLTPKTNSESPGKVNTNGIYALNAAGKEIVVEKTHIKGTLIIYNAVRTVTFQRACWIESAGQSFPTLLIFTGGADVVFYLDSPTLSETSDTTDYNEDGDKTDTFPADVRGVVWTQGSYVEFHKPYATLTGCLIGGSIKVYEQAVVNDDPSLAQQGMPGFVDPDMKIVAGTWREVQP